jgi:hypothetical protein
VQRRKTKKQTKRHRNRKGRKINIKERQLDRKDRKRNSQEIQIKLKFDKKTLTVCYMLISK